MSPLLNNQKVVPQPVQPRNKSDVMHWLLAFCYNAGQAQEP
jgi:hypothetical protein